MIAERVAEAAVERVGDELDAWLLPPLAYTKSNEHAWSAGTIWLSASTLLAVLDDLGRCVATTPARRLVFLNGHGGNSALLGVANRELRLHHGLMTFLAHPGLPPDQGGIVATRGARDGHPRRHRRDLAHAVPGAGDASTCRSPTRNVPEWLAGNRYVRFGGPVGFGWLSDDFGPDGHIGDPTVATVERGKQLFEGAVDAFGAALAEVQRASISASERGRDERAPVARRPRTATVLYKPMLGSMNSLVTMSSAVRPSFGG